MRKGKNTKSKDPLHYIIESRTHRDLLLLQPRTGGVDDERTKRKKENDEEKDCARVSRLDELDVLLSDCPRDGHALAQQFRCRRREGRIGEADLALVRQRRLLLELRDLAKAALGPRLFKLGRYAELWQRVHLHLGEDGLLERVEEIGHDTTGLDLAHDKGARCVVHVDLTRCVLLNVQRTDAPGIC